MNGGTNVQNKIAKISADSDLLTASFRTCLNSAERLKVLLQQFQDEGNVTDQETFINTVKEAINALEDAYSYEKKIITSEDSDEELIGKDEMDAVPEEVQDWLSSTFTKKLTISGEESKHKFRSIANVIRAGILVDKIYRSTSISNFYMSSPVTNALKSINEWEFNVFHLHETSNEQALKYISIEVLNKFDIINRFKIPMKSLEQFLLLLTQGYERYNNTYHNVVHAADVVQTVFYLIHRTKLQDTLTDLEKFGCFIAAMIHDYEHTGTTNNFHVRTCSHMAMVYNDRSVLENHHLSSTFMLMRSGDSNILSHLSEDEYREFRALVIDMVLATDMSSHFQQVKTIKHLLALPEYIDKSKALSLILHAADISHPCKPWQFHKKWTMSLMQEFFTQGDKELEKGLPFSPLCDKNTTLIPESQMGFINYIVAPCFQILEAMIESILTYKEMCKLIKEKDERSVRSSPSPSKSCHNTPVKNNSLDSPKSKKLDSLKQESNRRVQSADIFDSFTASFKAKNVKKLKNTPWNHYITENLDKWKEITKKI